LRAGGAAAVMKSRWRLATLARHVPAARARDRRRWGLTVRRVPTTIPSRNAGQLRRRLVVGLLVLASLVSSSSPSGPVRTGRWSGVESQAQLRCGRSPSGSSASRSRSGEVQLGRRFADCAVRGRASTRGESRAPPACDAERVRAAREHVPRAQPHYIDSPRFPADFQSRPSQR
jgi:hypothetical protein